MPDHVRRYRPIGQFRDLSCATLDQAIDPEAGERRPEPAYEHGVFARATGDLVRQNALGFRPQRAVPRRAALAVQGGEIVPAFPRSDLQIAHPQLGGLRHPCTGVVEEEQKRVLAPAPPGLAVGRCQHRLHLRPGQPSNRRRHRSLRRDSPDVTAPFDMSRIAAADEARERAYGRQSLIAGPGRATSIRLEMSEELQHPSGRDVRYHKPVHGLAHLPADEGQQQAEGVAIALAGVPSEIAFGNDVLAQEPAEPRAEGCEVRHADLPPH